MQTEEGHCGVFSWPCSQMLMMWRSWLAQVLKAGGAAAEGVSVEIVFPVSHEAVSGTGSGDDLAVVPGVRGGEGCSTAGGSGVSLGRGGRGEEEEEEGGGGMVDTDDCKVERERGGQHQTWMMGAARRM